MKALLILSAAIIIPMTVRAKEKNDSILYKNEISILGLGMGRAVSLNLDEFVIKTLFSANLREPVDVNDPSGFNLYYRRYLNKRFAVAGSFIYKSVSKTRRTAINDYEYQARYYQDYVGLAVEGLYSYIRKKRWHLYGLLGAGGYMCKERSLEQAGEKTIEDRSVWHARAMYQISPLGIQYGKKWTFWYEMGYGYKGIVSCGLSFRF